jgi:protein-S-isoprenylcysteine O-methyltransferase Ste14
MQVFTVVTSLFVLAGCAWNTLVYARAGQGMPTARPRSAARFPSFRIVHQLARLIPVICAMAGLWAPNSRAALFLFSSSRIIVLNGVLIGLMGLAVSSWAIATLGPCYSPCYDARQPPYIVKTGPYRFVSHPIYLGNLIALTGLFLIGPSAWTLLAISISAVYYTIAAAAETRELRPERKRTHD